MPKAQRHLIPGITRTTSLLLPMPTSKSLRLFTTRCRSEFMKKTILRFAPFLLLASLMSGCGGSGSNPSSAADSASNSAAHQAVNNADIPAGYFCVDLRNASDGRLPDNQIFVEIVSLPGGRVTYVDATGTSVKNVPQAGGTRGVVSTANADENLATHVALLHISEILDHGP